MTDERTLQQIANQLLPKYRLFLVTGQGGDELTKQERDMLVKIRDNAGNAELEELQPYVNRSTSDTMVASRAYGFLATILNEYQQGVREMFRGSEAERQEVSITSPGASFLPQPQGVMGATTETPLRDSPTSVAYNPPDALQAITDLVDEKYRPYFATGIVNLGGREGEQFRSRYPNADTIPLDERETIRDVRSLILSGGNPDRVKDFMVRFVDQGEAVSGTRNKINIILDTTNYVVGGEDPYGRTEDVAGFGRGTGQPATAEPASAPQVRPSDPSSMRPSVGTVGQPPAAIPPTDRGTLAPLTPEQRYGTGEGEVGPPDRMGGPATITSGGTGDTGTGDTDTGDGTGGVVVDGVTVETPYDDSIPEDWKQAASEIYGAYYSIINQNPEVADLIARAEAEKWGPEKFDYELEQTGWWKTTSLATRTFDIEMQRDPATVQARIDALAAQIREDALELNIRLSGETLNTIATEAIRQGWTEQQVTIALGDEAVKSQAGVTGLRYGYYGNKINEIAASYGVSVSDLEFSQLVEKFALGRENEESLTSAFQTRATALFPALSERLMAGETFSDIVEPYRSRASKILEQDFSASDFMDNDSFAQAVTYVGDDGKQRPMTYTEWGQYLRTNREFGYEYTSEAQSRAYQVANRIADIFGAI